MRDVIKKILVFGCVIIFSGIAVTACFSDDDSDESYFVTFKVDGTAKNFNSGFQGRDGENPVMIYDSGSGTSTLYAFPSAVSYDSYSTSGPSAVQNMLALGFDGKSTGSYTGGTLDPCVYKENGILYSETSVTFVVSRYSNGIAEGTFSGTLSGGQAVTEGSFRVVARDN